MTGEDTAAQLDALLKQNGSGGGVPEISAAAAWDLPRSHTERLVAPFNGLAG